MKLLFHSTFMSRFKFEFQSPRGTNVYVDRLTRMRTYYPAVLDRTSHMRKDPVILCNFPDNSFHYDVVRQVAGGISHNVNMPCKEKLRSIQFYCLERLQRRIPASCERFTASHFTFHTSHFTFHTSSATSLIIFLFSRSHAHH